MTTVEQFVSGDSGAFGVLAADPNEASRLRYALPESGFVVREVRGSKMRTVAALFDEFAAAWQFPYYFGANKDAFDDVMRDLDDWLETTSGFVVVVRDAEQLLADEPDESAWFTDAMNFYAEHWSEQRPPLAFTVILISTDESFARSTPMDAVALTL